MKAANYWIIYRALLRLDLEEAERGDLDIDPDDEHAMRKLFRDFILPEIKRWDASGQEHLRVSLAYFLQKQKSEALDRVLASRQDSLMPEPRDIHGFFRIMWDVLYPGESYLDVSILGIEENNDEMEMNKIGR